MSAESIEALTSISPTALRAFLEDNNWRLGSRPRENVELWEHDDHEILVPLSRRAPDYPKRIRNFVEDLARERGADEDDVARELLYIEDDVIDFRVSDIDESVPLGDAVKIIDGAKELAVVSACSAIRRRSYHGRARPRKATRFAETVRMGHTRRGSFIIPMISPVYSDVTMVLDQQQQTMDLAGESDFFPRRVTGMMADTLKMIYELAVVPAHIPDRDELNRAVVDGMSADVCSATAEMLKSAGRPGMEVAFHWAVTSVPPRAGAEQLEFPVEAAGAIEEVGRVLRNSIEVDDTVLYGFVSSLDRDRGDPMGTVKVRTLIDGRVRPVKVTLNEADYHVAAEANDLRVRVIVTGQLVTGSSGALTMPRPDSFRIDNFLPFHVTDQWASERSTEASTPLADGDPSL